MGDSAVHIVVLCGGTVQADWPAGRDADWGGARLEVLTVPLSLWGRLDRACAWEEFAAGVHLLENHPFDLVMGLDWHSWPVLRAMKSAGLDPRPFVFLNVRVFSKNGGISDEDARFYRDFERECVLAADSVVAQTQLDVESLVSISENFSLPRRPRALHCPLREDLRLLAATPPGSWRGEGNRRYVLCVARLSPEKNVEAFLSMVESLSSQLETLGLVPMLVGAPSVPPDYGEKLISRLMTACPWAKYRAFGPPESLAQLYRESVLLFHGALSEPYGMSLVEAAAFGVPSMVHEKDIGATERLRSNFGESFLVNMGDATSVSRRLAEVLSEPALLEEVGLKARQRALEWSEEAFAGSMLNILHEVWKGEMASLTCGLASSRRFSDSPKSSDCILVE